MAIVIRKSRPEDAEALVAVGEQAFASVRSIYHPSPAARANVAAAVAAS